MMFAHFCKGQDLDLKSIMGDNYTYSVRTKTFKNLKGKKIHKMGRASWC